MHKTIALQREYGLTLPEEFPHELLFVVAQVALSMGKIEDARDSANRYLSEAGTSGKYHGETQELLEQVSAKTKATAGAGEKGSCPRSHGTGTCAGEVKHGERAGRAEEAHGGIASRGRSCPRDREVLERVRIYPVSAVDTLRQYRLAKRRDGSH